MALSSSEQMRRWHGPALLSYGFRPFFLLGALWCGASMVLWIGMLSGGWELPTDLDPVSWHTHAFLFGYLGAIIAGFLLTAVPNWTSRLPVTGWRLAALVTLWAAGRLAVLFSAGLPVWFVAVVDLSFPLVLGLVILREILAGKNWRNLVVLLLLAIFTVANFLFHLEAAQGDYAAQGIGTRLGLAAVLLMIALIGGRVVPAFTRNWLAQNNYDARPTPPMQGFDKIIMLASAAVLLGWVLYPETDATGAALLIIGMGHLIRLFRWKGWHTGAEVMVTILHIAYLFVPLGAIALGVAILVPDMLTMAAALHLWTAGAFGTMTLAVMTRATLGHTGNALHANAKTILIYFAIIGATLSRFAAGFWPEPVLYDISGGLWCLAFFGYALVYGPMLLKPKKQKP